MSRTSLYEVQEYGCVFRYLVLDGAIWVEREHSDGRVYRYRAGDEVPLECCGLGDSECECPE